MKTICCFVAGFLCVSLAAAQNPPASAQPTARTDVYHVHVTKAALGKAAALADYLKTTNPNAPMPGHRLVLRHQDGEDWDYVVIEHLGSKATVDAKGNPPPASARDLSAWHEDTFVNGPSWSEFTRATGIGEGSATKTAGSVYVVSMYRAAPGHRDALEKMLSGPPGGAGATAAGEVLMTHLEGAPWTFLSVTRYNSWQDFATNESNSVTQTEKNQGGWFELRDHTSYHNDTLTTRIAP